MSDAASTDRRPRVLLCITRLGLGGAERVAFNLMELLRERVTFAVFTAYSAVDDEVGKGMRAELVAAGVPWFRGTRWPIKRGGLLPAGLALARAVREFQPDCIHYHAEIAEACGATMGQLQPSLARVPALRTVHNSIFWRFWPRIGRWTDCRLAHAGIACVSDAAAAEFARYRADSGVAAASRAQIVPNGVALPAKPPRAAPRDPQRPRLVFAGRFEAQKGPDVLAAALPLVSLPAGCEPELVCYGHGALEPELRAQAARPPRGWRIEVRAPTPHLVAVLDDFDLVLMPSRFEGLPLLAVEAGLCGLPVLATDAPGLREALPPDHRWKCPPGDPAAFAGLIGRALRETSQWEPSVRAAQDLAQQRFSPAAMGDAYLALYSTLAGRT